MGLITDLSWIGRQPEVVPDQIARMSILAQQVMNCHTIVPCMQESGVRRYLWMRGACQHTGHGWKPGHVNAVSAGKWNFHGLEGLVDADKRHREGSTPNNKDSLARRELHQTEGAYLLVKMYRAPSDLRRVLQQETFTRPNQKMPVDNIQEDKVPREIFV